MPLDHVQRGIVVRRLEELLQKRAWPKTICPSEAARALSPDELGSLNAESWRETMDDIRKVVWEMRAEEQVEVLQRGEVVITDELADVRGPIRVRSKKSYDTE
ncbi:hypothetical protein BDV96DRAFT_647064 [Lophiotrema nucula]|uniref:DUF3253 domain-containing protein n=1 Tax=Lophiotrema nucula TaxID=690887 RepID=A0A6A5Z5G2_9PLEO|nr:hypothetical protein BDV96DRAFT_647064 [Lophiotrema nucula]